MREERRETEKRREREYWGQKVDLMALNDVAQRMRMRTSRWEYFVQNFVPSQYLSIFTLRYVCFHAKKFVKTQNNHFHLVIHDCCIRHSTISNSGRNNNNFAVTWLSILWTCIPYCLKYEIRQFKVRYFFVWTFHSRNFARKRPFCSVTFYAIIERKKKLIFQFSTNTL